MNPIYQRKLKRQMKVELRRFKFQNPNCYAYTFWADERNLRWNIERYTLSKYPQNIIYWWNWKRVFMGHFTCRNDVLHVNTFPTCIPLFHTVLIQAIYSECMDTIRELNKGILLLKKKYLLIHTVTPTMVGDAVRELMNSYTRGLHGCYYFRCTDDSLSKHS